MNPLLLKKQQFFCGGIIRCILTIWINEIDFLLFLLLLSLCTLNALDERFYYFRIKK